MKPVFSSLLVGAVASITFNAQARPVINEAFTVRLPVFIMSQATLSAVPARALSPTMVGLRYPPPDKRKVYYSHWRTCGGGFVGKYNLEPRATALPVDPTLILAEAYRKCRMVKAAMIEASVRVASYPADYFGEFEYDGLLVSDWFEFSDETVLRQLFGLFVEARKEPDYGEMDFDEMTGLDLKLADYRINTGFIPDLLFEFIGDTTLRVEINLRTERMLILTGERWEAYTFDQWSVAALKQLMEAERSQASRAAQAMEQVK
jgi:hypothetical protein